MTLTTASIISLIVAMVFWWTKRKPASPKEVGLNFLPSHYRFSVYKQFKQSPYQSDFILEGNKIDELGYEIYKSYTTDLDKIDILIRENETGKIMKIVRGGDYESMIGVSHPEQGHIGYLQFEIIKPNFESL